MPLTRKTDKIPPSVVARTCNKAHVAKSDWAESEASHIGNQRCFAIDLARAWGCVPGHVGLDSDCTRIEGECGGCGGEEGGGGKRSALCSVLDVSTDPKR